MTRSVGSEILALCALIDLIWGRLRGGEPPLFVEHILPSSRIPRFVSQATITERGSWLWNETHREVWNSDFSVEAAPPLDFHPSEFEKTKVGHFLVLSFHLLGDIYSFCGERGYPVYLYAHGPRPVSIRGREKLERRLCGTGTGVCALRTFHPIAQIGYA